MTRTFNNDRLGLIFTYGLLINLHIRKKYECEKYWFSWKKKALPRSIVSIEVLSEYNCKKKEYEGYRRYRNKLLLRNTRKISIYNYKRIQGQESICCDVCSLCNCQCIYCRAWKIGHCTVSALQCVLWMHCTALYVSYLKCTFLQSVVILCCIVLHGTVSV